VSALRLVGFVAIAFGLGAYYAIGERSIFSATNLVVGSVALAVAALGTLSRWGRVRQSAARGPLQEVALAAVAILWGAVLVEGFADASGVRFDWTFEKRYAFAPATQAVLESLPGSVRATLYYDDEDPRTRRTRLLLEEVARGHDVSVRGRPLAQYPEDEDRFGIRSSNSVVLELGRRWERIERLSEGTLFEALSRLSTGARNNLYVFVGTGEGDLGRSDDVGYSGLRAALETEGYSVRPLPAAMISEIPADADAVLVLAPARRLTPDALGALQRYLAEEGGRLVALLDPGEQSGLEEILAEFGISSPDAVIVDPSSGPVDGDAPGVSIVAYNYAEHPVSKGLDRNRMTFFRGARPFQLRKPEPADRLREVVFSSGDSWLHDDPSILGRKVAPKRPDDAPTEYYPIVVAGEYERAGRQTRIVAIGDSAFAANRNLRALYNLDLIMNALHWVVDRTPDITLRPKASELVQFPVPIQSSLRAFYGVGLLIPELLLLAAGLVMLRRRSL